MSGRGCAIPSDWRGSNSSSVGHSAVVDIVLCRHGSTEWNKLGKWQGTQDTELAPEGRAQAEEQAIAFKEAGFSFEVCASSDLKRAHTTAEILASPHGVVVQSEERLRECSLGEFEGMLKSEIYGPKYSELFARLSAMSAEERVRATYFEGLETPTDITQRVMQCIDEVCTEKCTRGGPGSVLLVTHSTIIEAFLAVQFAKYFVAGFRQQGNILADVLQVLISNESSRQKMRFAKYLKAVANPQDIATFL